MQLEIIYKSIKNRKGRSHRDAKTQFRKIFRNYEIPLKKALNDEKTGGDLKTRIQGAITRYRELGDGRTDGHKSRPRGSIGKEPAEAVSTGASHASSAQTQEANQEAESSFESYAGEDEESLFEDAMYGIQSEGGHVPYPEHTFWS